MYILGQMCVFISNMKFLSLILWLGGLCIDTGAANNNDNHARRTSHDYTGSFGIIRNKSKRKQYQKEQQDETVRFMYKARVHHGSGGSRKSLETNK